MRIAYVSQPFETVTPHVQGGSIAIWMDRVIHAFEPNECEFIVYAKRFPNQPAKEKTGNIEYRRFSNEIDLLVAKPFRLLERLLGYPFRKRPYFGSWANYFFYAYQIACDLQKKSCDIVHVFNFSQFVPVIRALNPKVKIVLHMQCEWLAELDKKWVERRLKDTDMVLGCSNFTTNQISRRFPAHAHKCHTVYNGVDPRYFQSNQAESTESRSGTKNLLFVGRVSPEKGIHVLLQAAARVIERIPEARLHIVGPPGSAPYEYMTLISNDPKVNQLVAFYKGRLYRDNYFPGLQELASQLDEKVIFTGSLPHSETIKYYQNADILINPSLTEAFGMSLVEAMASQVPIIATRIGGMTEIIEDARSGLLIESDNPKALADAIIYLLENDSTRAEMGDMGYRKIVEKYTWDKISKSLWKRYCDLISPKPSPVNPAA